VGGDAEALQSGIKGAALDMNRNEQESKKALENALALASLCGGNGLASVGLELEDLARERLSEELRKLAGEDMRQFFERVLYKAEPVK